MEVNEREIGSVMIISGRLYMLITHGRIVTSYVEGKEVERVSKYNYTP